MTGRSTRALTLKGALVTGLTVLAAAVPTATAALTGGPDIIPAPASVVNSSAAGGASNDHQQGFEERQGVLLEEDLAVDGGSIPAGTVVDSHMIFLNIPDTRPGTVSDFNRTWTFDGPVLGVMSDGDGALEVASSPLLGAAGTTYPATPFPARGMELGAGDPARGAGGVAGEGYTVNGSSIIVGMNVSQPGDWIRVITLTPACTGVTASQTTLWPPNHKLRTISLSGAGSITITGVTQDEPVNGDDDGDTAPDAVAGEAADEVELRAERGGAGDGRVYRIAFSAVNDDGTACAGTASVSVPLNREGAVAVDSSPPSYDSFGS